MKGGEREEERREGACVEEWRVEQCGSERREQLGARAFSSLP